MGFLMLWCVRDTAATRGQYLALSKAWWSCFVVLLSARVKLLVDGQRLSLSQRRGPSHGEMRGDWQTDGRRTSMPMSGAPGTVDARLPASWPRLNLRIHPPPTSAAVCARLLYYCSDRQYCFWRTITHELLHSTWWNSARTCIVITAWNSENFKVIGHSHRTGFSDFSPLRGGAKKAC